MAGAILLSCALAWVAFAQTPPGSNLTSLRNAVKCVADSARTAIGSVPLDSTVLLTIQPARSGWLVMGPLAESLAPTVRLVMSGHASIGLDWTTSELGIRYEEPRRDGFFGSRIVDRVATAEAGIVWRDIVTGRIIAAKTFKTEMRDTIEAAAIPTMEDPAVAETHGTIPTGSFLSWFAEPMIMIGAIGVSIFLLFHVRSS